MYDFVDRPIGKLDGGGRFLVWSMRFWVRAVAKGLSPASEIGGAFGQRDISEALPHFNLAMAILHRHSRHDLGFGLVPCRRVHEAEALLLAILASASIEPATRTRQTLALMVEPEWVGSLMTALSALATRLGSVGLLPRAPGPQSLPTGESG
jgi:hypothetical protein